MLQVSPGITWDSPMTSSKRGGSCKSHPSFGLSWGLRRIYQHITAIIRLNMIKSIIGYFDVFLGIYDWVDHPM
jgi:hypothetical protein